MSECNSEVSVDLSSSFWVTRVPETVFSDDPEISLKPEFEGVFKAYDDDVQFKYLKSFGRVHVIYSSCETASLAQSNLHNHVFQGTNLKVLPVKPIIIGSNTLDLPPLTKQFLISPPASPPVGWEQSDESAPSAPCVDFSLVTALASLQLPGETQELIEATHTNPSIVLVAPEDTSADEHLLPSVLRGEQTQPSSQQQQQPIRMSALPRAVVQTSRPPLPQQN